MEQSIFYMPQIFPVTCHTDFVGKGSTFVAIEGYADNGVKYIATAIDKGATTIVVHNNVVLDNTLIVDMQRLNVTLVRVQDTRQALADLSRDAAGFPAKKVKIIGITGTKGKTTTAFLLEHCLRIAGYKTGLISSAGNRICDTQFCASLTTPQPDYLQQFLKLCVDQSVEYVVMEVAAQALTLHRVKDIQFDGIIFTNFSHEHLEFYATLDDYYAAKHSIFTMAKAHAPLVINMDDERGLKIKGSSAYKRVIGYGFDTADNMLEYKGMYKAESLFAQLNETNDSIECNCPTLFGRYNGYNILAAITMAHVLGVQNGQIKKAIETFLGVPGRLQQSTLANGARAFIDYAHNPSSFKAVLSTLRLLTDHLIVVFGAGGGKDKIKRPIMGDIACKYADYILLTSDNPRLEDPEDIINDIRSGIAQEYNHKVLTILDRQEAIKKAYEYSQPGSIIAILGKGPDEYQIVGTIKHYFSEHDILKQLL